MTSDNFPRVNELLELIENTADYNAYFHNFQESVQDLTKYRCWRNFEQAFQQMDMSSWEDLKRRATPYLCKFDNGRGWQQLISTLNEAYAYKYLIDIGCEKVAFIPTQKEKAPDLEGYLQNQMVLCEVKSIWESDNEVDRRLEQKAGSSSMKLSDEFFSKKFNPTLCQAESQISQHPKASTARCFLFFIITFDDSLGEYKKQYYEQIDQFLCASSSRTSKIIFFNPWSGFDMPIDMKYAVIINEAK